MKKMVLLLMTAVTIIMCTSCNKKESNKIAFLTDSSEVYDGGFNQTIWEGLETYTENTGMECTHYVPEIITNDKLIEVVDEAVENGVNVVVLAGSVYGQYIDTLQDKYNKITFIAVDVPEYELDCEIKDNVYVCSIKEEQAGYLAGYAVVAEGYTRLGFLGGKQMREVTRFGYGYIQGADYAATKCNADIEIKYTYGDDFFATTEDCAKMSEWYEDGTQVVFACGGSIYTAVIEAALENDGKMVGVDTDQHYIGEPYKYNPIITSAVKDYTTRICEVLDLYLDGKFSEVGGRIERIGLSEGDYIKLPNSDESWEFTQFTRDEYNSLVEDIVQGKIKVSDNTDTLPAVSDNTSIITE